MPRTGTGTDTNKDTLAQDEVKETTNMMPLVKTFSNNRYNDLWKMADQMLFYAQKHMFFTAERIGAPTRLAYCKLHKIAIGKKESKNDADYHNFTEWVGKLSFIACHFKDKPKEYDKWKTSGKGIYHVWAVTKHLNKTRKDRNKVLENNSKENLEKLADEGVVNAKEYADATAKSPKKVASKVKETTSWTAPSRDSDREWDKTFISIAKNDPRRIAKLVILCVERKHLSEDWEGPAQKELKIVSMES